MGRWMNRILRPAAPTETEAHIPLEDLARLAEGQVNQEERGGYIKHLNRCPACYEILEETLKELPEEHIERPTRPVWRSRPLQALAASLVLFVLIGGGLYRYLSAPPQVIVASLVLDNDLRSILMENDNIHWAKGPRIDRLASLLRQKGLQIKGLDRVELAAPYYSTKSLFMPKEILKVRIEKGVAYLEVAKAIK